MKQGPSVEGLRRLARNFWWSWDAGATRLFAELSPAAWDGCQHSPGALLDRLPPAELEAATSGADFERRLRAALARLDAHLEADPPPDCEPISPRNPVAYFCAEYGIHESLPLYSGGLGVLAGDHLKSASDLALPLVAVGLYYHAGYVRQKIDASGRQVALRRDNDPRALAVEPVLDAAGAPLELGLDLGDRELRLRAWRADVGRVALHLLDTDLPANRPEDREITHRLYGGDDDMRIRQEIVLGRGGVRLLRSLNIEPAVWHMNEGHAAFLSVERALQMTADEGLGFDDARERCRATTLFTTHTPVPAGHDRFDEDLVRHYLGGPVDRMGLPWQRFVRLGRTEEDHERFNMTLLALRFSSYCNGVSQLHGVATRRLLRGAWPNLPEHEIPVASITNGIHLPTWTHPSIAELAGASDRPVRGDDFAARAADIDHTDLWRRRRELRRRLLDVVRGVLERTDGTVPLPPDAFDERALLIGFARRFALYKRANLLLRAPERLVRLLGDPERPVRILVAGKAHPRDQAGQDLLAGIVEASRREPLLGKVFFVEGYGMHLARHLVQGVDVWLNTPRPMLEASGTSGMKAAANGALNLSIADGWWPEAADGSNGWTIGDGLTHGGDDDGQDHADSEALYQRLERDVVPLFFQRDEHDVPRAWLDLVRSSLRTIPPVFNTDRMVRDYLDQAYRRLARACLAT